MPFWEKEAKKPGHPPPILHLSLLQRLQVPLDDLARDAHLALTETLRGRVDRLAVCLFTGQDNSALPDEQAASRFWADGEDGAPQWETVPGPSPVPKSLLRDGHSVEQLLDAPRPASMMRVLAGMRRALWVALGVAGQLRGVFLAATRGTSGTLPREAMEQIAQDFAEILALRSQSEIARSNAEDLAQSAKLWTEISLGQSSERLLQQIVDSCVRSAQPQRDRFPYFAAMGVLSGPSSEPPQVHFRWFAGDSHAARLASSEPITTRWREALETRTVSGVELDAYRPLPEPSRVVSLPLLIAGRPRGVLVAGFRGASASLSGLQRLETRAHLAAAAIALCSAPLAEGGVEAERFLLRNVSDAVLLLNARNEITATSESARALLSANADRAARRWVKSRGKNSAPVPASAALLFKPAEWLRISGWLDKIRDSGSAANDGIDSQTALGATVRLRASSLSGGRLGLRLENVHPPPDSSEARAATELRTLMEWIDQPILLFDGQERLRAANPRFLQLFGIAPDELDPPPHLTALVARLAPLVAEPAQFSQHWLDSGRGTDSALREEVRLLRPAPRLLERVSRPMLDSAGHRIGRLEIFRDLTEQQMLHSRLDKSLRLAGLGQRISGIAHELSNPLTTILGYSERLLRNHPAPASRDDLQLISLEAGRAASILRQLLDSARDPAPPRAPLDLNAILSRVLDLHRFQLASDKIRVELALAAHLPAVLADAGQLQQIVINLISNARHALLQQERPGILSLRSRLKDSGRVLFEVSDNGPGIAEPDLQRIFDPFFTTKPAGIGTGLGLSIVKNLVHQNDGVIKVHSACGQGATFSVDFPAAAPAAAAPGAATLAAAAHTQPAALLANRYPAALSAPPLPQASGRILVVEDELTVAQLISDMLSDLGHPCDVFDDARQALASALNRDYALVICDMKMPALDGRHFYRALVEARSPLASRFLFVTGDILGIATEEFLRKHHLPHIAKPFRLEEFTEKFRLALELATAATPSTSASDASRKALQGTG